MEIKIADTFMKSLRRMQREGTWYMKTWNTFRYDIPRFIRNIFKFRKALYSFYCFDHKYNLEMYKRSLEITCDHIEKNGNEVDSSRLEKVKDMRRVIYLIDCFIEDDYYDLAEKELGVKYDRNATMFVPCKTEDGKEKGMRLEIVDQKAADDNHKIYARAEKISEKHWKEIFKIIREKSLGWWD